MDSDSDDNLIDEDDMRVPNQFGFLNLRQTQPTTVTNRSKFELQKTEKNNPWLRFDFILKFRCVTTLLEALYQIGIRDPTFLSTKVAKVNLKSKSK